MAELTYRQAVSAALAQEMARDDRVVLLGEDVASGGVFKTTAGLRERFGADRVWNTPISEQAIAGAAMGAAMGGLRPVAEIMFSDFYATCWDQVANEIAKVRYMTGGQVGMPLVLRGANGSGGLGFGSQHGQSVENWAMCVPGLKIVSPASPAEAFGLLAAAIRDDNPVLVFEHKALYARKEQAPDGEHVLPLGRARTVRPGRDLTLVGLSITVGTCLAAADELAARAFLPRSSICGRWCRWTPPPCSARWAAPAGWWSWRRTPASSAGAPRWRPSRRRRRSARLPPRSPGSAAATCRCRWRRPSKPKWT